MFWNHLGLKVFFLELRQDTLHSSIGFGPPRSILSSAFDGTVRPRSLRQNLIYIYIFNGKASTSKECMTNFARQFQNSENEVLLYFSNVTKCIHGSWSQIDVDMQHGQNWPNDCCVLGVGWLKRTWVLEWVGLGQSSQATIQIPTV